MPFQIPSPVTELSDEQITTLIEEGTSELQALIAGDPPVEADVVEAERIAPLIRSLAAERDRRAEALASVGDRATELREQFSTAPVEAAPAAPAAAAASETSVGTVTAEIQVVQPTFTAADLVQSPSESDAEFAARQARYTQPAEVAPVEPAEPVETSVVASVASRTTRPAAPTDGVSRGSLTIIAAADVPTHSTGTAIADFDDLGRAVVARMQGFPQPEGDPHGQMHRYPTAMFRREFPEDLICDKNNDQEVFMHAANEARLPGGNLTAAGGWCAPSEILYDLCEGETTEGLLSVPEVQVNRGGIKITSGPDFATLYAGIGFTQTEAQAIAATPKVPYDIVCPSFTDYRLDAIGVSLRAPILTNVAYPELIRRVLSGATIVHAHRVNASVITRIQTALGAARVMKDLLSTANSLLQSIDLLADQLRDKYRMSFTQTMELVVPFWVKGALRGDLGVRNGSDSDTVITDAVIAAHFAARHVNVQYVYDWQDLTATDIAYPATVDVMMYPAGTFVKGVSPIISLSSVYDAASLSTNVYTALFFEEGLLVAQTCFSGVRATLAVNNSGRTGIANIAAPNILP